MDGILVIDKDSDMTSRDVCYKVGKILGTKKIGHTGTLDPLATGVLVLCIGKGLKLVEMLTCDSKEYIATIKFGLKTDTLDITGNVLEKSVVSLDFSKVKEVLESFKGKYLQEVPKYSAVKINGKKLYEYARKGEVVELPKREVNIKEIEVLSNTHDSVTFRCLVSKGTYIRSLINDICNKLGVIGTMSSLRRTKQGNFKIEDAYKLSDLENGNYKILSILDVLKDFPSIDMDDILYSKVKNGAIIDKNFVSDMVLFKYKGEVISIYKVYDKDVSKAKPYRMFI